MLVWIEMDQNDIKQHMVKRWNMLQLGINKNKQESVNKLKSENEIKKQAA